MDEQSSQAIFKNFRSVIEGHLSNPSGIIEYLANSRKISMKEKTELLTTTKKEVQEERCLRLLDFLEDKPEETIEHFKDALKETGQTFLASLLQTGSIFEEPHVIQHNSFLIHNDGPMMKEERKAILKKDQSFIIKCLDIQFVVQYLYIKGVLAWHELELIELEQSAQCQGALLLDLISQKSDRSYFVFASACALTHNEELLTLLEKGIGRPPIAMRKKLLEFSDILKHMLSADESALSLIQKCKDSDSDEIHRQCLNRIISVGLGEVAAFLIADEEKRQVKKEILNITEKSDTQLTNMKSENKILTDLYKKSVFSVEEAEKIVNIKNRAGRISALINKAKEKGDIAFYAMYETLWKEKDEKVVHDLEQGMLNFSIEDCNRKLVYNQEIIVKILKSKEIISHSEMLKILGKGSLPVSVTDEKKCSRELLKHLTNIENVSHTQALKALILALMQTSQSTLAAYLTSDATSTHLTTPMGEKKKKCLNKMKDNLETTPCCNLLCQYLHLKNVLTVEEYSKVQSYPNFGVLLDIVLDKNEIAFYVLCDGLVKTDYGSAVDQYLTEGLHEINSELCKTNLANLVKGYAVICEQHVRISGKAMPRLTEGKPYEQQLQDIAKNKKSTRKLLLAMIYNGLGMEAASLAVRDSNDGDENQLDRFLYEMWKQPNTMKASCSREYFSEHKEESYTVKHAVRGRAFVMTMTETRAGWKHDIRKLKTFFDSHYIEANRSNFVWNPSHKELWEALERFAKDERNATTDCWIVVFMAHANGEGSDVVLDLKNGEKFKVFPNCAIIFSKPEYTKWWKGKPKIIIVQGCRSVGDQSTNNKDVKEDVPGVSNRKSGRQRKPATGLCRRAGLCESVCSRFCLCIQKDHNQSEEADSGGNVETDAVILNPQSKYMFPPRFHDYLVIYACQPGDKALRRTSYGSHFIQRFVGLLQDKCRSKDVEKILKETKRDWPEGESEPDSKPDLKWEINLFPGMPDSVEEEYPRDVMAHVPSPSFQDVPSPNFQESQKLPICMEISILPGSKARELLRQLQMEKNDTSRKISEVIGYEVSINSVQRGSFQFNLGVKDIDAVQLLKYMEETGELQKFFQREVITEEMKEHYNIDNSSISAYIEPVSYDNVLKVAESLDVEIPRMVVQYPEQTPMKGKRLAIHFEACKKVQRWFLNDVEQASRRHKRVVSTDGKTVLTISHMREDDYGKYKIHGVNQTGCPIVVECDVIKEENEGEKEITCCTALKRWCCSQKVTPEQERSSSLPIPSSTAPQLFPQGPPVSMQVSETLPCQATGGMCLNQFMALQNGQMYWKCVNCGRIQWLIPTSVRPDGSIVYDVAANAL